MGMNRLGPALLAEERHQHHPGHVERGDPSPQNRCATENDALDAARTQRGFDDGAFGRPSFVFQGELFFGKDKLDDVEAWLASRSS